MSLLDARSREYLRAVVHDVVCGVSPGARVAGSWRHGDFHASSSTCPTESDLDLVAANPHLICPADITAELGRREPRLRGVSVSVHPPDSFDGLRLEDGYFLNISEFVAKMRNGRFGESRRADYLRAKVCLLLCRLSDEERYGDVASRLGTKHARMALSVKLGLQRRFDVASANALLAHARSPDARALAQGVLSVDGTGAEPLVWRALADRATVPAWLRRHQAIKLGMPDGSWTSAPHSA